MRRHSKFEKLVDCVNLAVKKEGKIMKHRKLLSFMLVLVISMLPIGGYALSDESTMEKYIPLQGGAFVTVRGSEADLERIGEEELRNIVEENGLEKGDVLNIHEVFVAEQQKYSSRMQKLRGYGVRTETTRTYIKDVVMSDVFLLSAAKGQTTALTEEYNGTVSTKIIAGTAYVVGEIGGSISAHISTTRRFTGPPEGSPYNTRAYRIRYDGKQYSFTQKMYDENDFLLGTRSGEARVPVSYSIYSIDRKI